MSFLLLSGQKYQQGTLPSVQDYGAKADAKVGGQWNLNPTNCGQPFTSAAAANPGGVIYVPPGPWFMEEINGVCAWAVQTECVFICAPGAVIYFRGTPTTDCLLIEVQTQAIGTIIEGLTIAQYGGVAQSGRAGVVVHCPRTRVGIRSIDGLGKWGVIVESGLASDMQAGTLYTNPNQYINSNGWAIGGSAGRGRVTDSGTQGGAVYDPTGGAGIFAHGADSNLGRIDDIDGQSNNTSFHDATLAGCMVVNCYSEQSAMFGNFEPSNGSLVINGETEDFGPSLGPAKFISVGGQVAGLFNWSYPAHFTAGDVIPGGDGYFLGSPDAAHQNILAFWRSTPGDPNPPEYTFSLGGGLWGFVLNPVGHTIPGYSIERGFFLTEPYYARGPNLFGVDRPTLNSNKRWSWRQTSVVIGAGATEIVQTSPDWASRLAFLAIDPTLYDPGNNLQGAQTVVQAQVEIHTTQPVPTDPPLSNGAAAALIAAGVAALTAASLKIGPTMPLAQDTTGGVWGMTITNLDGVNPITVDILWRVELVQYATASNNVP